MIKTGPLTSLRKTHSLAPLFFAWVTTACASLLSAQHLGRAENTSPTDDPQQPPAYQGPLLTATAEPPQKVQGLFLLPRTWMFPVNTSDISRADVWGGVWRDGTTLPLPIVGACLTAQSDNTGTLHTFQWPHDTAEDIWSVSDADGNTLALFHTGPGVRQTQCRLTKEPFALKNGTTSTSLAAKEGTLHSLPPPEPSLTFAWDTKQCPDLTGVPVQISDPQMHPWPQILLPPNQRITFRDLPLQVAWHTVLGLWGNAQNPLPPTCTETLWPNGKAHPIWLSEPTWGPLTSWSQGLAWIKRAQAELVSDTLEGNANVQWGLGPTPDTPAQWEDPETLVPPPLESLIDSGARHPWPTPPLQKALERKIFLLTAPYKSGAPRQDTLTTGPLIQWVDLEAPDAPQFLMRNPWQQKWRARLWLPPYSRVTFITLFANGEVLRRWRLPAHPLHVPFEHSLEMRLELQSDTILSLLAWGPTTAGEPPTDLAMTRPLCVDTNDNAQCEVRWDSSPLGR